MESEIDQMQRKIDELTKKVEELKAWKQEHNSSKQSLYRMSTRLRKLCKQLTPSSETVDLMQKLAEEIRELAKTVTS